jgi:hypothetical protein
MQAIFCKIPSLEKILKHFLGVTSVSLDILVTIQLLYHTHLER